MLRDQFGVEISELGLRFYLGGKNRVYAYRECSIDVTAKREGIYFGTIEGDGLRLSIEGSFIVGRVAKKGVLEVDDDKALRWLRGESIEASVEGYWILKWGEYYIGCGKGDGRRLHNYVPKDRRITST